MLALKPTISNRWWPQQKVELYLILFWTILQFSFSFMNKSIIKFNYNNKFINSRHNTPIQTKQFNILSVSPQKKIDRAHTLRVTHPDKNNSFGPMSDQHRSDKDQNCASSLRLVDPTLTWLGSSLPLLATHWCYQTWRHIKIPCEQSQTTHNLPASFFFPRD